MTVAAASTETVLLLTGANLGPFATSWTFEQPSDVVVNLDTGSGPVQLVAPTQMTVTIPGGNPLTGGGAVTLNAALLAGLATWPAGTKLIIDRATADGQPTALGQQVGFNPQSYEASEDHIERQLQDLKTLFINRTLRGQPGDQFGPMPAAAARRGRYMGGDPITGAISFLPFPQMVSSIAALDFASLTTATAAILVGMPYVRTAGYAVAGDGGGGLYKAASGATPGGFQSFDGHWFALVGPINVCQFGADRTGAISSVAAFNGAIAYANASGVSNVTGVIGLTIGVPDGQFLLDAPLNPITVSGVTFAGSSSATAVLLITAAGTVFSWTGTGAGSVVSFGGANNLMIEYPSAPAAGATVFATVFAQWQRFDTLSIVNIGTLVAIGTAINPAYTVEVSNVAGYMANCGQGMLCANRGAGLFASNNDVYVNGVGVPANTQVSTMATLPGTDFVQAIVGPWDDIMLEGNQTNRFYHAVNVANSSTWVMQDFFITGNVFDYNRSDAILFNSPASGMGGIITSLIQSNWLVSWEGMGINISGGGGNRNHQIAGNTMPCSGSHGIGVSGASSTFVEIANNHIEANGRLAAGGPYNGIDIAAGLANISVQNNRPGLPGAYAGFGWQAAHGIHIGSEVTGLICTGNSPQGSVGGFLCDDNAIAYTGRLIADNIGANYAGYRSTGIFAPPATGVAWSNVSSFKVRATIGGAVTAISLDGAVTGLTSGVFDLSPGESFVATYTAATILFRVME